MHLSAEERWRGQGRAQRDSPVEPRNVGARRKPAAPDRIAVRQLHDWKGGAEVERLLVPGATLYARLCGATLARAHARWCDRIAIGSYLGKGDAFDRAVADFAAAYADQNELDYELFVAAVKSGRLTAQAGL